VTSRGDAPATGESPGLEVRPAREEDLSQVLALWAKAKSPHSRTRDDLEVLERLRAADAESLLVARIEGRLVGTLIAAWDGWRGNMYRLAVGAGHRRRGIGLALVRAGEEALYRRGARRISALVGADDPVAAALWCAAGYEHDERIARFVRNP
jgi:ribosomal protein S18 acetylase RimI-like enzyme